MSHYVERFEAAVQTLVGEGPVKQRLASAYSDHLEDLREVEMPGGLDDRLADLHAALHSVSPAGKQSPVDASVRKMSQRDAGRCAAMIVKLYTELVRQAHRSERPEPLKVVEPRDGRRAGLDRREDGCAERQQAPRFLVTGG